LDLANRYEPTMGAPTVGANHDRATRLDPTGRPSVAEFADELQQWLELPVEQADLDLSELSSAVRANLASEIGESQRIEGWKEDAHKAVRRLEELVRPLNAAMKEADPRAEIGVIDELVAKTLRTLEHMGSPEVLFHFARATKIVTGTPPIHKVLRMGRGVELIEDGQLIIRTMVDLGLDGVMQSDMHWMSDERIVAVGSIQQEAALQAHCVLPGPSTLVNLSGGRTRAGEETKRAVPFL
jgi:hypothetical protein